MADSRKMPLTEKIQLARIWLNKSFFNVVWFIFLFVYLIEASFFISDNWSEITKVKHLGELLIIEDVLLWISILIYSVIKMVIDYKNVMNVYVHKLPEFSLPTRIQYLFIVFWILSYVIFLSIHFVTLGSSSLLTPAIYKIIKANTIAIVIMSILMFLITAFLKRNEIKNFIKKKCNTYVEQVDVTDVPV